MFQIGLQLSCYCNIFLGLEIIKLFLKMSRMYIKEKKIQKLTKTPKCLALG